MQTDRALTRCELHQGGWAEHLLAHSSSPAVIDSYLQKCKDLGFDVIEISSGFLSIPSDDFVRLVEKVQSYGLRAKPELGIQFGAGGGAYPNQATTHEKQTLRISRLTLQ